MNSIPYGWIMAGYVGGVLFSFYGLLALGLLLDEKYPHLINRKWKRVLWLLSCLILLPIPTFLLLLGFSTLAREVKKFLSWSEDETDEDICKGEKRED
ncbi:MAG: hypothetical protein M0Z52_12300 [Actinomycetota bacterium]|nr:hypothetical protein [Nitrospiraceae bacterium]MDA8157210.1 hypothetical protein [Actinomycetota bacterium]